MKIAILFLGFCLIVENIVMWMMLKSSEDLVEASVELEEKRQEYYKGVVEMYELCMESNRSVDEHCKLVQEQYHSIINILDSVKNQEEN